jgi:protein gp37
MANNSKIEWTDDTANLWWGCQKVHRGCDNCYAEYQSDKMKRGLKGGLPLWGPDAPRREIKSVWSDLDKYQQQAETDKINRRVFVGSMFDIFEKPFPLVNHLGEPNNNANTGNLRFQLFYRIDRGDYPNLIFLFLTKRPGNINKYIFESWKIDPPKNVWFGTSIVDQPTTNLLVPQLLQVKGNKFLSIEPQLDKISLYESGAFEGYFRENVDNRISWVINGGESGPGRRPFNLDWARALRDECHKVNVPFFFKQIDKVIDKKIGIPDDLQILQTPF